MGNHRYQRKQHAGCGRLQHASADQQEKRRGNCAKRRSRGKRPRCGEEQLTGGETVDRQKAETGTMMPLTRGYIDMIHCAVEASMAKSAMMTGRAGDMTV